MIAKAFKAGFQRIAHRARHRRREAGQAVADCDAHVAEWTGIPGMLRNLAAAVGATSASRVGATAAHG